MATKKAQKGQARCKSCGVKLNTDPKPIGCSVCNPAYWQAQRPSESERIAKGGSKAARRRRAAASSCGCMDSACETCFPVSERPIPPCLAAMGCLCAGHARGNPASAACDTSEG